MAEWSVYIVRCGGGTLYTGIATDVHRRLREHLQNAGRGAKYLRGRAPIHLVYTRRIGSRALAQRLESRIKKLRKSQKEALISHDNLFGRAQAVGDRCLSEQSEREDRAMKVALGLKAHSGWAALVVLGRRDGDIVLIDRSRIELVEQEWAKQPYHAAERLKPEAARDLVRRGIAAARRIAVRQVRAAVRRERERQNEVTACAVLAGNPMPDWSTGEILAVHLRMHQAEGALFRDALAGAARGSGLRLVEIPEKLLSQQAGKVFGSGAGGVIRRIASLGRSIGPPWGKDQKDAALAALIALQGESR